MLKYPLIKFVIPFICGIIFSRILDAAHFDLLMITGCSFLLLIIAQFLQKGKKQYLSTLIVYITIALAGASYHAFSNINPVKYPFEETKYKDAVVTGKVEEIKLPADNYFKFIVSTDSIQVGHIAKAVSFKLLVRVFHEDSKSEYNSLQIGNKVVLDGTFKKGRTQRNPGEYDYQAYLESIGIHALLDMYEVNKIEIIDSSTSFFQNNIHNARRSIDQKINELHNINTASLLRGLLLADKSLIDYNLKDSYINAGVVHVLAVSGLHVGYIIIIFLFMFNRLNIKVRYVLTIFGLFAFLIITGSPASVFRATIMAAVLLLSGMGTRKYNAINSLAFAALILLVLDPNQLFMPGFQLSFSAVLSILIIYPVIQKSILSWGIENKIIKYILLFFGVSLSAQIGTLPLTLFYFAKLQVLSLFANLIVIPIIGIVVALGIFTLFLSVTFPFLAPLYASASEFWVFVMNHFILLIGNTEFSYIDVTQFSVYDSLIFYVAAIFSYYFLKVFRFYKSRFIVIPILLVLFLLFSRLDNTDLLPDGKLSILMIDVGQGDSFILRFPNGETALIDGGDRSEYFDNGGRVILPLLQYLGIDKIDYGVITHLDSDHYGGYISLIRQIKIGSLYKPYLREKTKTDNQLEELLSLNKITIQYFHKDTLQIANARLYILNDTTYAGYDSFDTNNKSGVIKLVHGENKIIFMGDAEKPVEDYLIKRYGDFLQSDILKVGHHGSKTSSTTRFLDLVKPKYGLISVGEHNRFNHPSKTVLDKLKEKNILPLRTDELGAVIIQSDGKSFQFINWRD
ncbi:MAG: DNA internalization-related competence protein ComEC/Rec2 [Bacteroidetes bacterium]|nr:DNA internalization-related competence protein ComEC/Rec2 [Bacteroidota bacterium]